MAKRVTLDAMIHREDFAVEGEEQAIGNFQDFPINNLNTDSPIFKLLRKPDFQRETNHWTPEQFRMFIESFLDYEVIPSLILWNSKTYIFVIDGGHRLSALRAWMENDYGDNVISHGFYEGEISGEQKRIAKMTRKLIEDKIGSFSELSGLIGKQGNDERIRRANNLFKRSMQVQWVVGNVTAAETSFYKINSQGTPLDKVEETLIRYRRTPIAIGARAIVRAGTGHKYWSAFSHEQQKNIAEQASELHKLLFEPQVKQPWKTLDVPLGGSSSPIEAQENLIEFLTIAGTREAQPKTIDSIDEDKNGDATADMLFKATELVQRITSNKPGSLGLHPAVYFYNEHGKYSKFFFFAIVSLFGEKLRNNDSGFFKKFTMVRAKLEKFLIDNKSLVALLPQNLGKFTRVPKVRDFFAYLVSELDNGHEVSVGEAIKYLGMRQKVVELTGQMSTAFSDDAKTELFIAKAIKQALVCSVCGGILDPAKSVHYDHKIPVRLGGVGEPKNGDIVHPYCNTAIKS